jgi:hypothetical protein
MKFSLSALAVLPLLASGIDAFTSTGHRLVARQNNKNNKGAGAAGAGAGGAGAAGAGAGGAGAGGAGAGAGGDPQTSLTLDPKVIAAGFANDGQDQPTAGQVRSLTSTNNFINFCLTRPDLPLTNGKQIKTGSCNPAPIGLIPSTDNMPSAKFKFPKNMETIQSNKAFTVQMAISKLVTGNFVNAQENYFAAPQQLDGSGQIVGHSHVVIETLTAIDQTQPTDPNKFAFFKGLNAAANGGVLTADVDKGLPDGVYRICSINTAANHQPAIVPVAQHGMLDDCSYFFATANGQPAGGAAGAGAAGGAAGAGGNANGQNAGGNNGGAGAGANANNGQNAGANNGQNNNGQTGAANNGQAGAANNGQAGAANNGQAGAANNGQNAGANNGQAQPANNAQQGQGRRGGGRGRGGRGGRRGRRN